MSKIATIPAAFVVAVSPVTFASPAAAQLTAQVRVTQNVIGIIAHGNEAAKAKFETAAKDAGLKTTHSKSNAGEDEVMVVAVGNETPAQFWGIYRAALAGRYGTLSVEVILVPTDADPNAKDYLDHARIYESADVTEPK